MRVPSFRGDEPVEYEVLSFPFRPWFLILPNAHGERTLSDGEAMVYWIRDIESERVRYVDSFFKRAGLSAPRTAKPIESVRALDRSLSEWIPVTFEPRFETYWHYLMPDGAPSFPDRLAGTNDNDFEELHVSLSLDIALWVVSQARKVQRLEWVVSKELSGTGDPARHRDHPSYLPTMSPGNPNLYPISESNGLIENALARPGSDRAAAITLEYRSGWTVLGELYGNLI